MLPVLSPLQERTHKVVYYQHKPQSQLTNFEMFLNSTDYKSKSIPVVVGYIKTTFLLSRNPFFLHIRFTAPRMVAINKNFRRGLRKRLLMKPVKLAVINAKMKNVLCKKVSNEYWQTSVRVSVCRQKRFEQSLMNSVTNMEKSILRS
jgi:hypothetical protein